MLNRRNFLLGTAAVGVCNTHARADEPLLTDDGLYKQPWFLESFLDLSEDLEGARKEGKRFAIMWELKGCPYCRETHFANFGQQRISDYVRSNFEILQLNIIGSRRVTDFDGTEVGEKELAAKYGIHFTPTFQFFPERPDGLNLLPAAKREIARAPGYLRPDDFLAMFRYVRENAYQSKSFREFLNSLRS